jgi:uncharacterized membrane protein
LNPAHFHLLVNHFPILLPIIGMAVLAAGYIFRSRPVQITALALLVAGTLATPLAMYSGEQAEESLEATGLLDEAYVEHHEEVAERYAVSAYVLGALALLGLVAHVRDRWAPSRWALAVAVAALPALFFASRAGLSGGEIRHTEIRPTASPTVPAGTGGVEGQANEHAEGNDDH